MAAYNIVAAGGTLYAVTTAGVAVALTLPSGVTISSSRPSRMVVLGRDIFVINGPSRGLQVDPYRVVRPMMLNAPLQPPTLSLATAGLLTLTVGAYVKYTYAIKDTRTQRIVVESDFSPTSFTGAIAGKKISATLVPSNDTQVNICRFYRTLDGGTTTGTFYHWMDVDTTGAITSFADDLTDSALPIAAAETELGTGPGLVPGTRMTILTSWKNRLWGVGGEAIDNLRYSGNGLGYGWPADYDLVVGPPGSDDAGITGLLPRRDFLGVSRRNAMWKVSHNGDNSDGTPNFEITKLFEGKGCWAPDSVVVQNDVAYFLCNDGFYAWGGDTIRCLSDEAGVRKWFVTDTYFNRTYLTSAFCVYNAKYNGIEIHMAAAGSSSIDRWAFFDIKSGKFFGPHRTGAFTPTCGAQLVDSNGAFIPAMGSSDGYLMVGNQSTFTDNGTAITLNVKTKHHDAATPGTEKLFKNIQVINKEQTSKGALRILAYLGGVAASVLSKTMNLDMREDHNHTKIVGHGRMVQLEFIEDTNNLGCELYGYEVDYHELGDRKLPGGLRRP